MCIITKSALVVGGRSDGVHVWSLEGREAGKEAIRDCTSFIGGVGNLEGADRGGGVLEAFDGREDS